MSVAKQPRGKTTAITPPRGRLFQARAAAEYLGITVSKARRLIARGELIALRTAEGRLIGVYETDCDAWVTQRRRPPLSAESAKQLAVDERIKTLLPKTLVFR